tara:strand:- start:10280 stop:10903 length:624 start_codon:yes stop_codon:yes gene_type:complete
MSESSSQKIYDSAVKKLQKQLQDSITGEAQDIIDGIDENFRKLKEERKRVERERQEKSRAEARKELDSLIKDNYKKNPAEALFKPDGLEVMLNKGELWRKRISLTRLYQQEFPKTNKYLTRICKKQQTHMDIILNYVAENGLSYVATGYKTPDDTFLRTVRTSYEDMDSDERRGLKRKSNKNKSKKKKSTKKKSTKKKKRKSKKRRR